MILPPLHQLQLRGSCLLASGLQFSIKIVTVLLRFWAKIAKQRHIMISFIQYAGFWLQKGSKNMILARSNKPKRKSIIAAHTRYINFILLSLVLFLMAAISALIISGINKENSKNLVRAYSIETAQMFYSYISENLTLVRKVSSSKAITEWFADEENPEKKALAFNEMMDYAGILQDARLFFGIDKSGKQYTIEGRVDYDEFFAFDSLHLSKFIDAWYFECRESQNEYFLKIDIERFSKTWRLWINHQVWTDGKFTGVFSSGLEIPDVFHNSFTKYGINKIRGYIINKYGSIQSDSTASEIYVEENFSHIREESTDLAFSTVLAAYLKRINGFFSEHVEPETVKLLSGRYDYAAINPINNTDWSVVIFYSGDSFSGLKGIMPLIIVILAAMFLYIIGRNTLISKLVYTPLNRLTQDVSEGRTAGEDLYGCDRDDEIGELARAIQFATSEQQRQEKLLHAVNSIAAVLLTPASEEGFLPSLLEGMETLGRCVDADRIHIWQSETINGTFYYVNKIQWRKEGGKWKQPAPEKRPYGENPEWEEKFSENKYINGPVSSLSMEAQNILVPQGVKSVLAIPLYMEARFYGFFSFDDCSQERTFMYDEIEILRSAGLMIVSALSRDTQGRQLQQAHERTQILLDAMPLSCQLWRRDGSLFDCNEEAVKLFKAKNKTDFVEKFWELSPEYQRDGVLSSEKAMINLNEAFTKGRCVFEWMHQMADGTPVPTEVILVRVKFGEEDIVAAYARDLREYKQMIQQIEKRDHLLKAVVANYSGIIWNIDKDYTINLYDGILLKQLGKESALIEGKKLEDYMNQEQYTTIISNVHKVLNDGRPQDWVTTVDGRILHARSTPIFDESGHAAGVVGSFDDITELSRLQADLEAALKEARKANTAKSSFLASMSHEMRTPLNAIIGLSELTLGSEHLDRNTLTNLEKISNAGMTLLSTVNDILDISKIEAGKFELIPVEYDLPSLLNDTISQSIMHKGEKPIEFILEIDEKLPTRLYGDDLRVKQILNNLLSNAFKYTMEGIVELSIDCTRDGSAAWINISVKDTGLGIRSGDIQNLFTDYVKMNAKFNRKIEGTGLGLPIAKKIVEMMGGSITVKSEYGKGSVFTARFRQELTGSTVIGPEVADSLKNFHYADHRRRRNSNITKVRLPYARVLVVDDVAINLDVAKGMMKPYGMRIDCASSGQEAINIIRSEKVKYNAVFMDHMMPDMDGIEAVRIIREEIGTEYAKTVPIIALTANAIVGNEAMFLSKGFQAFIPKPIEVIRLDTVIKKWVRDKNLEKNLEKVNIHGQLLPNIRSGKDRRGDYDRRSGIDRRIFGKMISGINLEKGIRRFAGDENSFLQILHSYAVNTRPLLQNLKSVSRESLAQYAITIHGIKGASNSVCAEQLGVKAQALEKAAKEGNMEFISANNDAFMEEAEKLIDSLDNYIAEVNPGNSKPKKDRPDSLLLSRLLSACEAYNMDGVDDAMTDIEKYTYYNDDGLVVWLRECVDGMNFSQIKEKLSAFKIK